MSSPAFEQILHRIIDPPAENGGYGTVCGGGPSHGALAWAAAHPDAEPTGCCFGELHDGPEGCTCWTPVYLEEQMPPRPATSVEDLTVQRRMCADCAFRKGSPERSDPWTEEDLFGQVLSGRPFWCHQGMRRPARWEHPDGRTVDGSPDDWRPPIVDGIPYQADGSPALLCAGWASRAARAAR